MARRILGAFGLTGLVFLSACGSSDNVRVPGQNEYRDDSGRASVRGRLGGQDGLLVFGTDRNQQGPEQGSGIGVNAYLWRATLDTLSFMPLSSADPFGGVIITEWYSPASSQNERFRATAYILGRTLRSDGVRVSLFRQEQRNGQWVDVPASNATASELEDRILARARELRSASGG